MRRGCVGIWQGIVLCCVSWNVAQADVRLPAVIGSEMVLQREQPVPIWGWADPGEEVSVQFRDQKQTAKADANGAWRVTLAPLSLGEPGTLTVSGKNKLEFKDVLVGDVWLCSGQSNMAWTVNRSLNADLEVAAADWPQIRLFNVGRNTATEPQKDVKGKWTLCTPETVGNFSAVAYFFGQQLHRTLDVPIGLINSSVGGTPSEAWTSPEKVASVPEFEPIIKMWEEFDATFDPEKAQKDHEAAVEKWKVAAEKAKQQGRDAPRRPILSGSPRTAQRRHCVLYNGMIAPLAPFAIKGAIWYQGEANASRGPQYRTIMPALIESWREAWGQGDFPFLQVQLANYKAIQDEPNESDWAELREAQFLATQKLPNVGMVCITDLGTIKDIHPKDKQNVGARLARLALHDVYKKTGLVKCGPTFQSLETKGNKATVTFDTHNGGRLTSYYSEPLTGFAVAGEDHVWHWATAKILNPNRVELTSEQVSKPVAVRYNWADNPQGNLYSEAYLPASPFRTDDWPRPSTTDGRTTTVTPPAKAPE